jgi:hypothetical protein
LEILNVEKGSDARRRENRTGAYWSVREERKRSGNAADGPLSTDQGWFESRGLKAGMGLDQKAYSFLELTKLLLQAPLGMGMVTDQLA